MEKERRVEEGSFCQSRQSWFAEMRLKSLISRRSNFNFRRDRLLVCRLSYLSNEPVLTVTHSLGMYTRTAGIGLGCASLLLLQSFVNVPRGFGPLTSPVALLCYALPLLLLVYWLAWRFFVLFVVILLCIAVDFSPPFSVGQSCT